MAETIRYDTSDDPVVAQSIAEKEAESLRVGEELMAKQEKMLAGKYKSAEDLEAAYLELQKKLCLLYTSDAADDLLWCRSRWSPYH